MDDWSDLESERFLIDEEYLDVVRNFYECIYLSFFEEERIWEWVLDIGNSENVWS